MESVSLQGTKLRSLGPRSTEVKFSERLAATVLNLPRTDWQPAGNAQPGAKMPQKPGFSRAKQDLF